MIGRAFGRHARWRRLVRWVGRAFLRWRFRNFNPRTQGARYVRAAGMRLWVGRGVFDPSLHFTSGFFARYILTSGLVTPQTSVLDIGTGTGVLALAAALAGAPRVVAIDVNPEAVRTALRNVTTLHLEDVVEVRHCALTDLGGERFDFIVCNPPYFRGLPGNVAEAAYMGGRNHEWFKAFSRDASRLLADGGRVLMVLGDAADVGRILEVLSNSGWRTRINARRDIVVEVIYVFELTRSNDARATS